MLSMVCLCAKIVSEKGNFNKRSLIDIHETMLKVYDVLWYNPIPDQIGSIGPYSDRCLPRFCIV